MRRITLIQLAIAAALLAATLGGYGFWYASVRTLSSESQALGTELGVKNSDSARVLAAKEALTNLASDEASVRQYLINPGDVVPFLEDLEETGSALGASVEVISVSANPGEGRGTITLSTKIIGSFDSVLRTLGAIEYGPYDSRITMLTFDTIPEGENGGKWTAVASFTIGTKAQAPIQQ